VELDEDGDSTIVFGFVESTDEAPGDVVTISYNDRQKTVAITVAPVFLLAHAKDDPLLEQEAMSHMAVLDLAGLLGLRGLVDEAIAAVSGVGPLDVVDLENPDHNAETPA
jgi:hypothetical protein